MPNHLPQRAGRRITTLSSAAAWLASALIAASSLFGAAAAHAQAYPTKPIRLIVGPGPDVLARQVAQQLTAVFGQQVNVEPLPSAGGIVAASTVAHSPPDGYTLLFTSGSYTILDGLQPKLPYDLQRDLEPVTQLVDIPFVLLANPALPVRSLEDLVKLAQAKPGKLNCASSGTGTTAHMGCELLKAAAQINIVHVPYKGIGPAMTDLMSGQVDIFFSVIQTGAPYAVDGRLRPLAVTGAKRSALLPDVPTMEEAGYGRGSFTSWNGIHLRAGTPEPVVARLQAEIVKIVGSPEMRKSIVASGLEPVGSSRADFSAFVRADLTRWAKVIKESGVRID